MLTKRMKKYVESKTKAGYDKHTQTEYDKRLLTYATLALKDLKLLAETLPEEQLKEIFNRENMTPFFQALFLLKDVDMEKDRIIGLWRAVFDTKVFSAEYAVKIVPKEVWQIATPTREDDIPRLVYNTVRFFVRSNGKP
ncbi:MAG: hypothetical protein ABR909_06940 [Candidatus Bathyarchaeia archaeon]